MRGGDAMMRTAARDRFETSSAGIVDPTRTLAAAVIERAIEDAGKGLRPAGVGSGSYYHRPCEQDRREARLFLCSEAGHWAQAREFWADLAGFDPNALRQRAMRMIVA